MLALPTLLALSGCQVAVPLASAHLAPSPQPGSGVSDADTRRRALKAGFPDQVQAALERLQIVTGLGFAKALEPQVVLRAFGDERIPYELRARIVDGRRRVSVHVNIEVLAAGVRDADRLLLRALADAAFQDAAQRHGVVPRWLSEMAGTAAAGELEEVLTVLQRRALAGEAEALHIDAADAAVAVQTGAAALLLLSETGRPETVRALLRAVADGDGADAVMARLAHEPDGNWIRPAANALRERVSALDPTPWRLLARAEQALAEEGGAGLDATLPAQIPSEVRAEVQVLRARAAADEGDHARAGKILADLGADAAMRLRDPAAAIALRIRVELRPGGNAALARRLALELETDYPQSEAGRLLRRSLPLLGVEEDPQQWLRAMRARIERDGSDDLDLGTLARYVMILLQDHRAGAAQRFFEQVGERAAAPEFADVRLAVAEEIGAPTQAARERSAERLAVWLARRDEDARADVLDSGPPAAAAMAAALQGARGGARALLIELAAGTLGAEGALALVQADWQANASCLVQDLQDLSAAFPYPSLSGALGAERLARLSGVGPVRADALWEEVTFGLSDAWLQAHPGFLRSMRSDTYAVRQAAFDELAQDDPREATPSLVARGLQDPAALLRRSAASLAGEVGFVALVRRALDDDAWLVREAGARALADRGDAASIQTLLDLLANDPSGEVRGAAALGLLTLAAGQDRVIDALLATQVEGEVRLRDAIAARLAQLEPLTLVRGIERGWARALQRPNPNRGYLFRTSLLYQRVTQQDLGYYPGADKKEMRAMVRRMRAWIGAREASVRTAAADDGADGAMRDRAARDPLTRRSSSGER